LHLLILLSSFTLSIVLIPFQHPKFYLLVFKNCLLATILTFMSAEVSSVLLIAVCLDQCQWALDEDF
jgi:hypothetical protein